MLLLATFSRTAHALFSQLLIAILAFPAETQLGSQGGSLDCAVPELLAVTADKAIRIFLPYSSTYT